MTEAWVSVVGYEGCYEVSSQGRVRSLDRWVDFVDGRRRFCAGRLCKLKINQYGYPLVLLSRGMARKRWALVHLVVLTAFRGERPPAMDGCHEDGDRTNAQLDNLRWDTRKNNHADKRRHGTLLQGEKHPSAVLSTATIAEVRAASGTMDALAARFGISRTHAWNIQNGKRRTAS